jgi:HlyD family secretion protein
MLPEWLKPTVLPLAAAAVLSAAFALAEPRTADSARGPVSPDTDRITTSYVSAEGRLVSYPGAEVRVATDYAGVVERVDVDEDSLVRAGAVLARIRARDTEAALTAARARVAEIDAEVLLGRAEADRAARLARNGSGSAQSADRARRDIEIALARRATALAEIERIAAELDKSSIRTPIDGVVIERFVDPGEAVAIGAPIATVVDFERLRIEAEVDEYDSARIGIGAPVSIRAEGHDHIWRGRVEAIPRAVAQRRLKPQDPAKPVDTRVLLVKIALLDRPALKFGQRVEVSIGVDAPALDAGARSGRTRRQTGLNANSS